MAAEYLRRNDLPERVDVHGHCEPRFSAVKEAFRKNFEAGSEVDASCAVTLDGKFVVDIWEVGQMAPGLAPGSGTPS
jgi:hypothetical protein